MQALDEGIANVTGAYRNLQIFDDTVWLLLADNGGMPSEGGFNVPLRGHKATVCACSPLLLLCSCVCTPPWLLATGYWLHTDH